MFAMKQIVLVAACVALALSPAAVVAEPQSQHLRIHITAHKQASSGSGVIAPPPAAPLSSADGSVDSEDDVGSESGSGSAEIDIGSDEDSSDDSSDCTGPDESEMSVEGAEGVYCVKGKACVADFAEGLCPEKQDGLPNGSVCAKLSSGVYGCTIHATSKHHHKKHHHGKKN